MFIVRYRETNTAHKANVAATLLLGRMYGGSLVKECILWLEIMWRLCEKIS